jgi:hypothetical protein
MPQTFRKQYHFLYHSAPDIPPPHCFHADILLTLQADGICQFQFRQEFTDREELPKEEIEAEGFSLNDDFEGQGELPALWWEALSQLLNKSQWKEAAHGQVLLQSPDGSDWLEPVEPSRWEHWLEELIQACLEAGGKEAPLEMALGKLEKNQFYEKVHLQWSFVHKEIQAEVSNGTRASFALLDWDEAQAALKSWTEEEAGQRDLYQLPGSRGWYWLINDDVWLPYRKGRKGKVWEWVDNKMATEK